MTIVAVYDKIESFLSRFSDRKKLAFTALLSLILVIVYFSRVLAEPDKYMIGINAGDNAKNYFTLKSYIDQPCNDDLIEYHSMNYPYPEVIYFTDNTPLLAVSLKMVKNIFGLKEVHPIFFFNLLSALNFVICSVLLFLLLKHFVKSGLLVLLGSITLAFANVQSIRYYTATVNLGYSSIMVATILLAVLLVKNRRNLRLLLKYSIITAVFIISVSFIHLYYLLLILVFLGPIVALIGFRDVWLHKSFRFLLVGGATGLSSFGAVLSIINFTDPYSNLRRAEANGYNWINWKLNFSGMFKAPDFFYSRFLIEPTDFIGYESLNYLGCFALYGGLLFLLVALVKGTLIRDLKEIGNRKSTKIVVLVLGISLVSFFIALGPEYSFSNDEFVFHNYLNVFNYASNFTDKLTHFRCLGRFAWVFFWSFNLLAFVLIDLYLQRKNRLFIVFLFVIGFFMIKDLTNTGEAYRRRINLTDCYAPNRPAYVSQIAQKVASQKFDAIMILPFFLVGSENYDNTLDAFDENFKLAQCVSDEMKLPMMSSMMSRTPLPFNTSMFNLYRYGKMDKDLATRLKGKRILILKSDSLYNKIPAQATAFSSSQKEAVDNSRILPTQLSGIQPLGTIEGIDMWSWLP